MIILNLSDSETMPNEFVIGRKYHCSWAKSRGMVWRLISYNETTNEATLKTPRTKKTIVTQLSSLRDINKTILLKSNR